MEIDKFLEEEIIKAVHKAAGSIDYGEVRIKIDKRAPQQEIVVETQEKIRFEKTA